MLHAEEQKELFWALLLDGRPLQDLKMLNLLGFDWSARDDAGRTLMVCHIEKALAQPKDRFEDALNCIEWLIRSGVRVGQKCTGGESTVWSESDKAGTIIRVKCKGLNAISFVQSYREKMHEKGTVWRDEVAFLDKVMSRFAAASNAMAAGPRVSIHEGIATLWEKSLAAKDSHDLTMETADGLVTAHAHMLKAASSVVTAMLESPMKEGKAQRIEVKDTPSKAVSLFVEILYTCSVPDELDHQSALHALDLAHRWQVDVVVAILSDLLAGMVTDESFSVITEHAILKGLERLKAAAQRFGAESKKVQADLKAGRLPAAVALLFHGGSPSKSNEPKPKRRRV